MAPERHLKLVENNDNEKSKKDYRKIILKSAATVTAVLALIGLAKNEGDEIIPVKDKIENESSQEKNIELEFLKVGDEVQYKEGVFLVDSKKIKFRKEPAVIQDSSGDSNRYHPKADSDQIYVQNPVLIKDTKDLNGPWFEAVGADGQEVFFSGNKGGISDVATGKEIALDNSQLNSGRVIATTAKGNVVEDGQGNNDVLAMIQNVN
jgi:hypothetical protein